MTDTLSVWNSFEVNGFFNAMRQKLRKREPKQVQFENIETIPAVLLIKHLHEEMQELCLALGSDVVIPAIHVSCPAKPEAIQDELVDLANLCGMLYCVLHNMKNNPIGIEPLFEEKK